MHRILRAAVALALSAPLLTASASSLSAQEESLYQRLGGYDAIAASMDELLERMEEQKFASVSYDSRMRTRQLIVDFVCNATGGPCYYAGRDMKTTHAGLDIGEEEWNEFVATFVDVMNDFNVPEQEQNDLAELLLPMKDQIVE